MIGDVCHTLKCPRCDGTGEISLRGLRPDDLILAMRKERGVSQQELADAVKISRSQIANLEGGRGDPSFKTLQRIATALGVATRDLMP